VQTPPYQLSTGLAFGHHSFETSARSLRTPRLLASPADIAEQLGIQEKTLRKHFRRELNGGKFKVDMLAGKTVTELMKDKDARVRLEAAKYYTARRMGWKETNVNKTSARTAVRSKPRT
jgi:predicted transcriptional regulator